MVGFEVGLRRGFRLGRGEVGGPGLLLGIDRVRILEPDHQVLTADTVFDAVMRGPRTAPEQTSTPFGSREAVAE
ncbi:MAG: hypothetical protein EON88_22925, partial [Brevundimonas sp.]